MLVWALAWGCSDQKTVDDDDVIGPDIDTDTQRDTEPEPTKPTEPTNTVVDEDKDGSPSDEDCDDQDPARFPGAEELCDGIDNDCDGEIPGEGDADADGVFDFCDFCPIQVDLTAAPNGDGSFAHPFTEIQPGIDLAPIVGCWFVEVHPGTYEENIDFIGEPVVVYSSDGPEVTTIDGGEVDSVVQMVSGEPAGATLDGFTITNGSAQRGAGIHIDAGSATIVDNIIVGNHTRDDGLGGGLFVGTSNSVITGNTITDNSAGYGGVDEGNDGGGIAIVGGAPTVQNNTITHNLAGDGGGIWVVRSDALLANNLIDSNAVDDLGRIDDLGFALYGQGGGIDLQADTDGTLVVANIITHNIASSHGGGVGMIGYYIDTDVAEPTVINNMVAFNSASGGYGDGMVVWGLSEPNLVNNIVTGHTADGIYGQYDLFFASYNDAWGNGTNYAGGATDRTGDQGNFSAEPGFRAISNDGDVTNDDLTLGKTSPCIDAGDPTIKDPDGTTSDIGAYGGPFGAW